MLASSFGLSTSVLAALRAIESMGKRPLDQGSSSRKRSTLTCLATEQTPQIRTGARSTPTRPATEQTPEISADAEATMHDPGNASILRSVTLPLNQMLLQSTLAWHGCLQLMM